MFKLDHRLAGRLLLTCAMVLPVVAEAEVAPAERAVIPASAAPESLAESFAPLAEGSREIAVPGAAWIQLKFGAVELGEEGTLSVTDAAGQSQTFTQSQLTDWGGLTAMFNGASLQVMLTPGAGAGTPVSAELAEIVVGLPPEDGAEGALPDDLLRALGDEIDQFRVTDPVQPGQEGQQPQDGLPPQLGTESICGTTDDRVPSANPRVGRIMPIGCTGWLVEGGIVLTAGHCISPATQTLQFNVPPSAANGAPQAPAVRDQYPILQDSIVATPSVSIGNDWAIFRVGPNTETLLTPDLAQGATFALSNTQNPGQVRIDGYGVDGPPPNFGAGGPRDASNQTQQTHAGALNGNTGGPTNGRLDYVPDTQGGNSGSPVIVDGTTTAIGIHTNGGCGRNGGANAGTSFRNAALWTAIQQAQRFTDDIVWQHINGQVHYWPMRDAQRQGGINIFTPVGPDWRLKGVGDLNGDRTEDILWQHINGQVHSWPMANGRRLGGNNIFTPVGPEWRLVGAGDLDGNGSDDVLWQHINGQVHYWPMANGQRQGGHNIFTPVGPEWRLIGAGDLNGDRTDDILWQHINGQVHYWPMANGQRQGGHNIFTPVGPEWRLIGAGDLNGDRTDDILWQHIGGQAHYWPIQNGQRQGGFNIFTPVGPEWRLIGAGGLD